MSLKYLYNKLEAMNPHEREVYIKKALMNCHVKTEIPCYNYEKNPLGYLVMVLTDQQLISLIPQYLRELSGIKDLPYFDKKLCQKTRYLMVASDLVIPDVDIGDLIQVFDFGSTKYEDWDFCKYPVEMFIPSFFRHMYKDEYISPVDEESGLPHLAHAASNVRMIKLIRMGY